MWLTFDWDDVLPSDPKVEEAFGELNSLFGIGNVWYRISSSQTGLHIVIGEGKFSRETSSLSIEPIEFTDEQVMEYRKLFANDKWGLECNGRLLTDEMRRQGGTTWGRIFTVKNGKVSGEWLPC